MEDRGAPFAEVEAKRVADKVPLRVDWHDYLINTREPGKAVAQNYVFRPPRSRATGLEYKCTTAGVTSQAPYDRLRWPTAAASTITDGTVVWTAQAVSTSSLRATVSSDSWTADTGLTLSDQSNTDLIYTTYAAAGTNGERYEVKHAITLSGSPAEIKEALILLPVKN
jgi:hypothetical protein